MKTFVTMQDWVVVVLALLVASPTAFAAAQEPVAAVATVSRIGTADPISGKATYERNCAACHGADGAGILPGTSNFATSEKIFAASWEVIFQHVRDGYQSPGSPMAMPARGGDSSLTDEDLWNALAYIRQAFRDKK